MLNIGQNKIHISWESWVVRQTTEVFFIGRNERCCQGVYRCNQMVCTQLAFSLLGQRTSYFVCVFCASVLCFQTPFTLFFQHCMIQQIKTTFGLHFWRQWWRRGVKTIRKNTAVTRDVLGKTIWRSGDADASKYDACPAQLGLNENVNFEGYGRLEGGKIQWAFISWLYNGWKGHFTCFTPWIHLII